MLKVKLHDLELGYGILDRTPKAKTTKERIGKLDSSDDGPLCHKGHHQENEVPTQRWGQTICKSCIW